MGMFDTVIIECPRCFGIIDKQTKSGSCSLKTYSLDDKIPMNVLGGVLGPFTCDGCQTGLMVELVTKPVVRVREMTDEEKEDWEQ